MKIPSFLLLLLLCACQTKHVKQAKPITDSKSAAIEALGNRYLELGRFSGTIFIGVEGEMIYSQSFGLANYELKKTFNPNTAFKIGGVSEWVNIKLLAYLIQTRGLDAESALSQYVQSAPEEIVIKDLLNPNKTFDLHLRGRAIEALGKDSYPVLLESFSKAKSLKNTFLEEQDAEIAQAYLYHNYRGQGLELQEAPSFDLDSVFSSGGLKSTAEDLFQLIEAEPADLTLSGYTPEDGFSYAISHSSDHDLTIIILSNRRHPAGEEIREAIRCILDDKEYQLPLPREPYNIDPALLANYEGSYSLNGRMNFRLIAAHDSLFVYLGEQKVHLIPQSDNQFYMGERDAAMRFLSDSTGAVNRIMLLDGFLESEQIAYRDPKE